MSRHSARSEALILQEVFCLTGGGGGIYTHKEVYVQKETEPFCGITNWLVLDEVNWA